MRFLQADDICSRARFSLPTGEVVRPVPDDSFPADLVAAESASQRNELLKQMRADMLQPPDTVRPDGGLAVGPNGGDDDKMDLVVLSPEDLRRGCFSVVRSSAAGSMPIL